MRNQLVSLLASASLWAPSLVDAKGVFAHYMIGTIFEDTDHAEQDIDQAIAAGFDAFALNVGEPGKDYAYNTINQLFNYAEGKNFGLFFNFDFYGTNDLGAHRALYDQFKDRSAYYKVIDKNFVSTYSGGALGADTWRDFRDSEGVFLVPNVEADPNYYNDPSAFWSTWGGAIDGIFTWETAWPVAQDNHANTSDIVDVRLKEAADANIKAYIAGISPLQYKRYQGNHYYRVGDVNLPERMTQILTFQPEFAEVITWNDAGESHYIANGWPEGLNEEILSYGSSEKYPHHGWQPLIASFNSAFKQGLDASQMTPQGGSAVTGSMWYHGVLKSCPGEKPAGVGAVLDAVNYAVVLPPGSTGHKVRVSSNGQELASIDLNGGLNYNSIPGMVTGAQKIEVLNDSGSVIATASSSVDVVEGPVGDFCNYNYYVAGLA